MDGVGDIYVGDSENNRVVFYPANSANGPPATQAYGQQVDGEPVFTTSVASLGPTGLNRPTGLALDSNGDLYVADASNNRVLSYFVTPVITSITPTSGPVGTAVTIKGTGLLFATAVTLHGLHATIVKDTSTKIKVGIPSGATKGKLKVVTPGGKVKAPVAFTVT